MRGCRATLLAALIWAGAAYGGDATAGEPVRWMAFHSYKRDLATVRRFGELGIDTVTCFPANNLSSVGVPYSPYPPVWLGPNLYDFDSVDRQFADLIAANPDAKIVCEVDLNTPAWWPRWLGRAGTRDDSFTKLGKVAGSEEWRKDTSAFLRAFLEHVESRYGDRVIAYVLTCGMTLEWQDYSWGEESVPRRAAWRRWMTDRGRPDPVDIPPASVRDHVSHGVFRDPVEDALALDYWRFHHELTAETILYYARAAKEATRHRVPIGVYYGYVLEHGAGRLLREGHLAFDRVIASPDVDFFLAPGSYSDRQIGGASGFMVCLGSIRHHGKGFVHEVDHRTHTAMSVTLLGQPVPGHQSGFPDEPSTIAGLRREFALALTSGAAMWWFDMFGRWYEGDAVLQDIARMKNLWDRFADPGGSVAQVAVIVDAESMYYLSADAPFYNQLLSAQRQGLGRIGAPYEVYSFADLPTLDLKRFRLVLFPNLFVVDAPRLELLRQKVFGENRTVVWVYAPGIIADGKYDPAGVERLTGLPFGTDKIAERDMGNWRSVLSPQPNLSGEVLRSLAEKAGAHIYSEAGEPLYATDRLIALHTATGGARRIVLPREVARVVEVFSNRVVAENAREITLELRSPDTVLLELQ